MALGNISSDTHSITDLDAGQVQSSVSSIHQAPSQQSASMVQSAVRELVGADLALVEELLASAISSKYEQVSELTRKAQAMGGKRLRPMLVLLSAQVMSSTQINPKQHRDLAKIAASVELVHTASLVHDDVMDHATERRHQPTLAKISGASRAILLGDFLFTRAYAIAASCGASYPARQIARAATELCEGEFRQQCSQGNWGLSPSEYKSVLTQKTASLCAVGCRLGAWRVGGNKSEVAVLAKYGRLLGLAFQVFDDWLDYWGTDSVGKTLGTDFMQAKPTLPMLRYLNVASPSQLKQMKALLDAPTQDGFQEAQRLLNLTDASDYTLNTACNLAHLAEAQLAIFADSKAKNCLRDLARFSVARTY